MLQKNRMREMLNKFTETTYVTLLHFSSSSWSVSIFTAYYEIVIPQRTPLLVLAESLPRTNKYELSGII